MLCNFHILAYTDGLIVHRCRNCGATRKVRSQRLVRKCSAAGNVDAETIRRRLAICHRCDQRPSGCWKAREYGCQRAYREAGQQAAETADCPIEQLKQI